MPANLSLPIDAAKFWRRVQAGSPGECWPIDGYRDKDGYGLYAGRKAHRVAFFLANGYWPPVHTRHTCNNPPCCNARHLVAGTAAENHVDMVKAGRWRGNSKLTSIQVDELQTMRRESGISYRKLGAIFGITGTQAHAICIRRTNARI